MEVMLDHMRVIRERYETFLSAMQGCRRIEAYLRRLNRAEMDEKWLELF